MHLPLPLTPVNFALKALIILRLLPPSVFPVLSLLSLLLWVPLPVKPVNTGKLIPLILNPVISVPLAKGILV